MARLTAETLKKPKRPVDVMQGDGTFVETRPSKWQQTWDIVGPYVTAPVDAWKGLMDADLGTLLYDTGPRGRQAVENAFNVAGTVTGGSSVVPKQAGAVTMGVSSGPKLRGLKKGKPRLTPEILDSTPPKSGHNRPPAPLPRLEDVLTARAQQMALPEKKRIQPDPNRTRLIDTDYQTPAPFNDRPNLADNYPRNPDPMAALPLGDRARVLVDYREQIADRLAEKIKARGLVGTDVQYFYSSDGPIYRAAIKAGLSDPEAKQYINDFAQYYAATSPRTDTTQNLRNATLAMAKKERGIPLRDVIGPGTIDAKGNKGISEKGYPMMTGKGGIHGQLLDAVQSGAGIDSMTNPKPSTFGGNMGGNLSGVTADTHAIRGVLMALNEIQPGIVPDGWIIKDSLADYKASPQSLNPSMIDDTLGTQMIGPKGKRVEAQTEYPVIADIWHTVADRLGVKPAEAQSLGWFSLGDETNLGSELKTVAALMDDRINVTSQALGVPPEVVAKQLFRRQIPLMGMGGAGILGALAAQQPSEEPRI